jgi:hypothetical protein
MARKAQHCSTLIPAIDLHPNASSTAACPPLGGGFYEFIDAGATVGLVPQHADESIKARRIHRHLCFSKPISPPPPEFDLGVLKAWPQPPAGRVAFGALALGHLHR